jgi:atypical dual specificity phosphatase
MLLTPTPSASAWLLCLAVACATPPPGEGDARDLAGGELADPAEADRTDPWGEADPTDPDPMHADPTNTTDPAPQAMLGFSFVRDDVAAMPFPYGDDLDYLAEQGIDLVVSLTEAPVDPEALDALGIEGLHLPIEDVRPPTLRQQVELVRVLRGRRTAGERVAVHCLAGLGRTGTMLATWFVAEGATADEAIDEIRSLRPGSIETAEQEEAVRRFARAMEER